MLSTTGTKHNFTFDTMSLGVVCHCWSIWSGALAKCFALSKINNQVIHIPFCQQFGRDMFDVIAYDIVDNYFLDMLPSVDHPQEQHVRHMISNNCDKSNDHMTLHTMHHWLITYHTGNDNANSKPVLAQQFKQ